MLKRRKNTKQTGSHERIAAPTKVLRSFNHDGMDIQVRKSGIRSVPIRHFSLFVVMALSLRMVTYSELGPAGYAQRMNDLVNGSTLERVAGQFMAMDSVSETLARTARGIVRSIGI